MTSHDWEEPNQLTNMNTYIWKIESLDYAASVGGQSNVVFNINWRLIRNSQQGKEFLRDDGSVFIDPFVGQVYGNVLVEHENNNNFIEYADLTQETIVGWLEASLGSEKIDKLKADIDLQIEKQINPETLSGLPWSN